MIYFTKEETDINKLFFDCIKKNTIRSLKEGYTLGGM